MDCDFLVMTPDLSLTFFPVPLHASWHYICSIKLDHMDIPLANPLNIMYAGKLFGVIETLLLLHDSGRAARQSRKNWNIAALCR